MNKHEYTGERPFWYDGKMVNEVGFCEDFLQKHPMVRVGGSFFTREGRINDEESVRKAIYEMLRPYLSCGLAKRASALLEMLKQEDIHTCIETNGCHVRLPELFPLVDYLIMDCKHHDPNIHQDVTGASCALTHQNLRLAIAAGKQPAVRIPLIGGFNASAEDALQFAALFRDLGLPGNGTLELLPYHEYGKDKYRNLGMEYTMTDSARIPPDTLAYFTRILTDAGITCIRT